MPTALEDLIETLKGWTDRPDISDAVHQSWITMTEQRISNEVRYKDMVVRDRASVAVDVVALPTDWVELIYVRYSPLSSSPDINVQNGRPLHFCTNDQFWDRVNNTSHEYYNIPSYSIFGNNMLINPIPTGDGAKVEVGYYQEVPPLSEGANWVYNKQIGLYISGALVFSAPWLQEDERLPIWAASFESLATKLTDLTKSSSFSGSPLTPRRRSFG